MVGAVKASVPYQQQGYDLSAGADIAFSGVADDNDALILGGVAGFTGTDVTFTGNNTNVLQPGELVAVTAAERPHPDS